MIEHCSFLYAEGRFRIVDSENTAKMGGHAALTLESRVLRLTFAWERGDLNLEFRPVRPTSPDDWFTHDVVWQLITGKVDDRGALLPEDAVFLERHLDEIEERFAPPRLDETVSELRKFEGARASRLFGL